MKKTIIVIIAVVAIFAIAVLAILGLVKEKVSITAEEFATNMKSKGYVMTDATSQFAEYDYVEKVYIASAKNYQIEFYTLSTDEYAMAFYNNNKANFEATKGNSASTVSSSAKNYSKYSLTSNSEFKCISRIDNTAIYIDVDEEYKAEVKEVLKEMGY